MLGLRVNASFQSQDVPDHQLRLDNRPHNSTLANR